MLPGAKFSFSAKLLHSQALQFVVRKAPLQAILLESDAPYQPGPKMGRVNNSAVLGPLVRKVAELKGMAEVEVVRVVSRNVREFYRL